MLCLVGVYCVILSSDTLFSHANNSETLTTLCCNHNSDKVKVVLCYL